MVCIENKHSTKYTQAGRNEHQILSFVFQQKLYKRATIYLETIVFFYLLLSVNLPTTRALI